MPTDSQIEQRLNRLEAHLKQENPILQDVVQSFRRLDAISRRMGFLGPEESYAVRTPWWPLISVLGTYSSGKSTFLNSYLNYKLQSTGNQAVDDKFSVLCYTRDSEVRVLPGLALDSDARFPLYRIGEAIEEVAPGEGKHVDSYVQLKTCPSEKLRGKILIDSPGFDADAQRTSTLRITDRIIDLSDLVLVFFDARHPETGSMRDTLQHLVQSTVKRRDANKFLYILNQVDVTAREDNPEEVFAAWQRALAQHGLTAGKYFSIYNPDVAVPIEDEKLKMRYERKMKADTEAIHNRIEEVKVERAYRIVGMLEESVQQIEERILPAMKDFLSAWRRQVLMFDGIGLGALVVIFLVLSIWGGAWNGLSLDLGLPRALEVYPGSCILGVVVIALLGWGHFSVRKWVAKRLIEKMAPKGKEHQRYVQAFRKNVVWWRSILRRNPAGWGLNAQKGLARIQDDIKLYIQKMNDYFTDPSGAGSDVVAAHSQESAPTREE